MNFDSHEPIHDPGAEDEARTFKESSSDGTHSSDGYDYSQQQDQSGDVYDEQNESRGPRNQPQTPAQQFDPYYNTGLDYANQLPDQMYGDSQQQDNEFFDYGDEEPYDDTDQHDQAGSWDGSKEGSYDQSSGAGSSAYSQSDGGSYNQGQDMHAHIMQSQEAYEPDYEGGSFASVESSNPSQQSESRSFGSQELSRQSEQSDTSQPTGVHHGYNESGSDFNGSGQSFGESEEGDYEEENQQYQDQDEEYASAEGGSYDDYSDNEEEELLPPLT